MEKKIINPELSLTEVAEILSVSKATIRNWIKTDVLPASLCLTDVLSFKKDIDSGRISRLKIRANKRLSPRKFIPKEYTVNNEIREFISLIIEIQHKLNLQVKQSIFIIALAYLENQKECEISIINDIVEYKFKRNIFQKLFKNYCCFNDFSEDVYIEISNSIKNINCNDVPDFLGLVYQSIRNEGDKSSAGSYYTPMNLVKASLDNIGNNVKTFLDPCCGTGIFIIEAIKRYQLYFENVFGFDIDEIAVFLCKINLLMIFRSENHEPNIFYQDFLADFKFDICIDAVATNPPWGANKNNKYDNKYNDITNSGEIYSMIILKSLDLSREFANASFVLPASVLDVKMHSDLRKYIIENYSIKKIQRCGKVFKGVFSDVLILDINKSRSSDNNLQVKNLNDVYSVPQNRFLNNESFVFDIDITPKDFRLLNKIYSLEQFSLKNNAKWGLGIVTGNNSKHLLSEQKEGSEPIYQGRDILPFKCKNISKYIVFDKNNLQQTAKIELYRAKEKLIYRFISDKPVFAYDNSGSLCLNSANILIPKISELSIKVVLALLNSDVCKYIYRKQFFSVKVLKSNIEQLPLPKIPLEKQSEIETLVDNIIYKGQDDMQLQNVISDCYKLSKDEIEYINQQNGL